MYIILTKDFNVVVLWYWPLLGVVLVLELYDIVVCWCK